MVSPSTPLFSPETSSSAAGGFCTLETASPAVVFAAAVLLLFPFLFLFPFFLLFGVAAEPVRYREASFPISAIAR